MRPETLTLRNNGPVAITASAIEALSEPPNASEAGSLPVITDGYRQEPAKRDSGNDANYKEEKGKSMEKPTLKSTTETSASANKYVIESAIRSLRQVTIPNSVKKNWDISISSSTGQLVIKKK